jgi:hypothetical protein
VEYALEFRDSLKSKIFEDGVAGHYVSLMLSGKLCLMNNQVAFCFPSLAFVSASVF